MILSCLSLLRTLIGWIDLALLTLVLYLLSFLPKNLLGTWYRHCYRYWSMVFVRALRVDLFLHQKNHHPLPKQYILIGNHPSAFEDIGMPALFDVYYLAKIEVKDWWIVGRISKAVGTFYVDRESKDSRQGASNELKETLLSRHINIGLYPEGGCKGRRICTPFRYGAFDLSIQSDVPIVPVFLHYEAQEDFEWQHQHLLHKLWMILTAQNHRANYYVYDAIDPKQFPSKEAFCEHVQHLYVEWQKRYLD